MGIDITIQHENGEDACDIMRSKNYHIADAIEFASGTKIKGGLRSECYAKIEKLTGVYICDKYDQEDNFWTLEEIKEISTRLSKKALSTEDEPYKKFFNYLVENKLRIHVW